MNLFEKKLGHFLFFDCYYCGRFGVYDTGSIFFEQKYLRQLYTGTKDELLRG